jgi:hypothetical protein
LAIIIRTGIRRSDFQRYLIPRVSLSETVGCNGQSSPNQIKSNPCKQSTQNTSPPPIHAAPALKQPVNADQSPYRIRMSCQVTNATVSQSQLSFGSLLRRIRRSMQRHRHPILGGVHSSLVAFPTDLSRMFSLSNPYPAHP